jgi:predicted small integral membrane protein
MKKSAAMQTTTTDKGAAPLEVFGFALLDIGWQLAVCVIGPLWLGAWADRRYDTKPLFSAIAFIFIIISFFFIVRRVIERLPKAYGGKS